MHRETGNFVNFTETCNYTHIMQNDFNHFHAKTAWSLLLSIGTDDLITNGERPWSSDFHQQMATIQIKSYGGVLKVESVACLFKHKYLTTCIICLCVIYASYTWMQVLTIKTVNQKLCDVIFKFPFLIFWILSVFSFKFFSSMIWFICPHNCNFCFSPKT
jgi:hypothetical protein